LGLILTFNFGITFQIIFLRPFQKDLGLKTLFNGATNWDGGEIFIIGIEDDYPSISLEESRELNLKGSKKTSKRIVPEIEGGLWPRNWVVDGGLGP